MPTKAVGSTVAKGSNGSSHLTPAFLAEASKSLRAEVMASSGQICKNRGELGHLTTEKGADGDRESNEHHFLVGMEKKSSSLHEAAAALNALHSGAYGICEGCGEEISAKRLKATGFKAVLCIVCQNAKEKKDKQFKPREAGRY